MSTAQKYEDARDDANLLLQKLDSLLESMVCNLVPSMNVTVMSIARQLSPPPPWPRKVIQARKGDSAPGAASTDSSAIVQARTSDHRTELATSEEGLSKKCGLNCQDSAMDPRKKPKVSGSNDNGKENEPRMSKETSDGNTNHANETPKRTESEKNEPGSSVIVYGQSCGKIGPEHKPPPPASSPQERRYEDAGYRPIGSNASLRRVSPETGSGSCEENDNSVTNPSSKKRQRSASASSNDTPPRKRARTDSGPPAAKASIGASKCREPCQGAAANDHASGENGALQASISSEMILDELQKHRDFINDMQNQIYSALGELKAQKWLLWYRLCCCTVVSSKKYSYRGLVRRDEEGHKYAELKEVFEEAEKLHEYCSGLVERAKDAVWSSSQMIEGEWLSSGF